MRHAIYAIAATADAVRGALRHLSRAGYRSDEISCLARQPDPSLAQRWARTAWKAGVGAILACGPLAQRADAVAETLAAVLPAPAAPRCEDALARGGVVIAVHTDNAFELEPLAELLAEGGCLRVAVTREAAAA